MTDFKKASTIIDKGTDEFLLNVRSLEEFFWTLIKDELKHLKTNDSNQLLRSSKENARFIAGLNEKLNKYLEQTKYFEYLDGFLVNFDELLLHQQAIHLEVNDIKLTESWLNRHKKGQVDKTLRALRNEGLAEGFMQPIKESLNEKSLYGGNLIDIISELETTLISTNEKNGALLRYITLASRDSLRNYNGVAHTAVKNAYKLNATRYVGSIVKKTRQQCRRWVSKRIILDSNLETEIEWMERNGTGFIKGTNASNFLQNLGGYNCRHAGIPVRA